MIWYEAPPVIGITMFVTFILTAAFQGVIILEAGELIRDKRALGYFRLLYGLLAIMSAVMLVETLLAIASIEGGIFLEISALPRYVTGLPALLFLYGLKFPVELPVPLRPSPASFFVPLLWLPRAAMLPMPLAVAVAVFAGAWFAMDTVGMLLSFRAYARTEITRSVMPHIVQNIEHGICVANRSGWVLEGNPAFYSHCKSLGLDATEQVDEFEAAIAELSLAGRIDISAMKNGRSIRTQSGFYFLQRSSFKTGGRTYIQLVISDVTKIARTALELEKKNEQLTQKNRELEKAITAIVLEEVVRERERLCRSAHDSWSQRLAVAGLAVDMLSGQEERGTTALGKIASNLEAPVLTEPVLDLSVLLHTLPEMYRKLGVEIQISGRANFAGHQQEVLGGVLQEALANAVRHAYARQVSIVFFENAKLAGITIQNACLDNETSITEGRGLYDMKSRVQDAGGSIHFEKDNSFIIQVSFPIEPVEMTGGVC